MENTLIFCCCDLFVLNRLQAAGQYERAAAVALFNNKIREAIEILSSQKENKNSGGKGEVLIYYCERLFSAMMALNNLSCKHLWLDRISA